MDQQHIESSILNTTDEALDMWAFVEVMGHSKIAGRLTIRKLGMTVMLQVDVLKPDGSGPAYSKLYSPSALFSITPVDRAFCQRWSQTASSFDFKPVPYIQPAPEQRQLNAVQGPDDEEDYDDEQQ